MCFINQNDIEEVAGRVNDIFKAGTNTIRNCHSYVDLFKLIPAFQ